MKFYSEKLNTLFDTAEALEAAESKAAEKSQAKNSSVKSKNDAKVGESSPTKKQLATKVEEAEDKLKEAYSNYDSAKIKAEELSKQYLEQLNSILEPAQKAVKEAEKNKYNAIKEFNDSYGAYQVTYTGARAADEMMKAISNINIKANRLFRDMFWL